MVRKQKLVIVYTFFCFFFCLYSQDFSQGILIYDIKIIFYSMFGGLYLGNFRIIKLKFNINYYIRRGSSMVII